MIMKNKKGIAIITTIVTIVLILLVIYLILYLPIPKFAKIKNFVNYIMILIVWFALQVGLVFLYFKLGTYAVRGWNFYKNKIQMWTINVKRFLLTHR